MRGRIATWYVERGYGFISPANGGDDIFAHAGRIDRREVDRLARGVTVDYDVITGGDGRKRAINVYIV